MRNLIISSINYNLDHAVALLDTIDSVSYCDSSIGPYHSSIGSHVRHILDFFNCIVDGLDTNNIDLTARKRDEILSTNKEAAKNHIYMIV